MPDNNNTPTAMIHSHFAQLRGVRELILMNDGCLLDDGCLDNGESLYGDLCVDEDKDLPWIPRSVFPPIDQDFLLYLLLMGGKGYPAFKLRNQAVPYAYYLMNVTAKVDYLQNVLDLSNSSQKSNDGNFLESLLSTNVCAASHCQGVKGTTLKEFLPSLIFHLQNTPKPSKMVIENLQLLGGRNEWKFPFLSPPDKEWPRDIRKIRNMYFGNLKRTKNVDRIDLEADGGITGEAKDYGTKLELRTLIRRIPNTTKLHLVFTRNLQQTYFKKPAIPFQTEFENSHALKMSFFKIDASFFKIDASKPVTKLEPINGLPHYLSRKGQIIVIFFLIDKSIKF
jgi:hypothetical protein